MLKLLGQIDVKIMLDEKSGMQAEVTVEKIKKGCEELVHIHACASLLAKTLAGAGSRKAEIRDKIVEQLKNMMSGTIEKGGYTPKWL